MRTRPRVNKMLGSGGGPCRCSLADLLRGVTGHTASSDYMSQVNVPSRPVRAQRPLAVISLDGVVDARLPYHLSGGYTDVIARPYLQTLMVGLISCDFRLATCADAQTRDVRRRNTSSCRSRLGVSSSTRRCLARTA